MTPPDQNPGFFQRLSLAFVAFFRALFDPAFAGRVQAVRQGAAALPAAPPAPAQLQADGEKTHASALFVMSMLQREGRLIDFLQEDIGAFPDAEVGAAARVVHEGCRRVLRQYLRLEPVLLEAEGASVDVPAGFDAQRIRLTGNLAGQPPFRGSLKHHGWTASEVKFPPPPPTLDPRVIAPAEVELS